METKKKVGRPEGWRSKHPRKTVVNTFTETLSEAMNYAWGERGRSGNLERLARQELGLPPLPQKTGAVLNGFKRKLKMLLDNSQNPVLTASFKMGSRSWNVTALMQKNGVRCVFHAHVIIENIKGVETISNSSFCSGYLNLLPSDIKDIYRHLQSEFEISDDHEVTIGQGMDDSFEECIVVKVDLGV